MSVVTFILTSLLVKSYKIIIYCLNLIFLSSVPYSPGGVAYNREMIPPDWVLDYWHPLEKAQYPEYFARREQRKKEYVEWWEKTYGKPTEEEHH